MMQKQRSPYTGGGFNLQQLKATSFGKNESLNSMPFLVQLAHHVQQRPPRLSTLLAGTKPSPGPRSPSARHAGCAEHDRGLHGATTRSYQSNSSFSYEGEMPPLPLGDPPLAVDDSMGDMDNEYYGHKNGNNGNDNNMEMNGHHMDGMSEMDEIEPLENMGHMGMDGMDNHMEGPSHKSHLGQGEGESPGNNSDTDSEIEYSMQELLDTPSQRRWRHALQSMKSVLPLRKQGRYEGAIRDLRRKSLFAQILLMLQLLAAVVGYVGKNAIRLRYSPSQIGFCLRRSKFQLRSILRQVLWRTINFKGNDVLYFFVMMVITPWLFCLSLVALGASLLYHFMELLGRIFSHVIN